MRIPGTKGGERKRTHHLIDNPRSFTNRGSLESHRRHVIHQLGGSDVPVLEGIEIHALDFFNALGHRLRGLEDSALGDVGDTCDVSLGHVGGMCVCVCMCV